MFYAQWCENCHKFAPVWDVIATLLQAGTTKSNLILSLFDCELNTDHSRLCDAAGVTHYPTLLHVGAGPYPQTDPLSSFLWGGKDKAVGPYGAAKLERTVKFQGDFAVGDSVLDWVKAMRGLSRWHRWNYGEGGWLKGLRGVLRNPWKRKKSGVKDEYFDLPVGVPSVSIGNGGANAAGFVLTKLQKEVEEKEAMVTKLENKVEQLKLSTEFSGNLIQSFLFSKPAAASTVDTDAGILDEVIANENVEGKSHNATDTSSISNVGDDVTGEHADPFVTMVEIDVWKMSLNLNRSKSAKNDTSATTSTPPPLTTTPQHTEAISFKACIVDLSLDYCTRLSTKLTTDYLAAIEKTLSTSSTTGKTEYPSLTEMEGQLRIIVNNTEPYCAILNPCYKSGFVGEGCRPPKCPFGNAGACRYVAACLQPNTMREYKAVIETSMKDGATIVVEEEEVKEKEEKDDGIKKSGGAGGWGMKK